MNSNRLLLLFPPTWSLNVGNPHLALPLLSATARRYCEFVEMRDLNWEAAVYYGLRIPVQECLKAVSIGTMDAMNDCYFPIEDRMMHLANQFGGEWNLQLGFRFKTLPHTSSESVKTAIESDSPFTAYFKNSVLPSILAANPSLIGVSLASVYQIIPTMQLCQLLRKQGYGGRIVLGGNTISRLAHELQNLPWMFCLVDGLVVFQGELPIISLLEAVHKNRSLDSVPNLIWRDGDTIRQNSVSSAKYPNSIPTPDFETLPVGQYWGVNYLPLLAARGCYFAKCSFCAIPFGYGSGGFAGLRKSQLVLQDILKLEKEYSLHRYKFMDEALSPQTLSELPELLIHNALSIEWEGYARIESCWKNQSFLRNLARSGFRKAYFGLEVYPLSSRGNLGKNDRGADILEIVSRCADEGIKVHLFCMFGFPGTGKTEADHTIEFILKHNRLIDTVDLNAFTYARHTRVNGIKRIERPGQDLSLEYEFLPISPTAISSSEVEKLTTMAEDIIWDAYPKMLHPIYRLVSPWMQFAPAKTGIHDHDVAVCS